MATLNRVELIGYVGDDPDFRTLESGVSVATFSLATNTRWKTKDGEKKERTDWHRVVVYRGLADTIGKYVKKGAQLYLVGALQYRDYEKDGETHYVTEVIGLEFQFLDKKDEAPKTKPPKKPAAACGAIDDEDIPF